MSTTTQDVAVHTYSIDPSHSRMGFTVRHLGFSKVRGAFEQFEGSVQLNPADLSTLVTEGSVQTASITTNEPKRDEHLRSADFFEAETHPTLSFKSTGVTNVSGNSFTLTGDLTMRGVTRSVAFAGEYLGEGGDPWGGTRVGLEATTSISRKEFGIDFNIPVDGADKLMIGDKITINIVAEAVLQA